MRYDDFIPGNLQNVPGEPDDAARARAWRAREETYRRYTSPQFREAEHFLRTLDYALHNPELEHWARSLLFKAVAQELKHEVFAAVWAEVSKRIRDGNILVQRRPVGPDYHVLSFAGQIPGMEDRIREYFLDLLTPILDQLYQPLEPME